MKNLPAISCPKNQHGNALKTAVCCSVDLWLINAKFVSYNNQDPPPPIILPSVYLTLIKWTRPTLPSCFHGQKLKAGRPRNEAK